jgi:DNA invertase Pin-like site-specific DNA recombinase
MPVASDERYNWVRVWLDAIDQAEMRELVVEAWRMVVPKVNKRCILPGKMIDPGRSPVMTRRAGLLVRLSTVKVTERLTDDATERQEERSRAYCTARDWTVVRLYSDVDVSAYRKPGQKAPPFREGLEQALTDIETGVIDTLVFWKLDRLTRDPAVFVRVQALCERHGAVLASVTEPLDTSTPMGEATALMLVSMARMESQNISIRVAAQREQAANRGIPTSGGWPAFGYRYVPKTETEPPRYEIVPAEAEVIREAGRRVLAGESLNSIAKDFDRRGIRARPTRRAGKAFYARLLRQVLLNPSTAGIRVHRGEQLRQATWEPILDRVTWAAVRTVLLSPERARPGRPPRWPLAGFAVCGNIVDGKECGNPLRSKRVRGEVVLACDSYRADSRGCGKVSITYRHLETIVLKMIEARDWSKLAGMLSELRSRRSADPGLVDQLTADEVELRSLAVQRALRKISEPEWLAMREALTERIAAAEVQLGRAMAVPPEALDGSKPITESWPKWTPDQQRGVLRAIFHRIVVLPATRRGPGPDPDRVEPIWRA